MSSLKHFHLKQTLDIYPRFLVNLSYYRFIIQLFLSFNISSITEILENDIRFIQSFCYYSIYLVSLFQKEKRRHDLGNLNHCYFHFIGSNQCYQQLHYSPINPLIKLKYRRKNEETVSPPIYIIFIQGLSELCHVIILGYLKCQEKNGYSRYLVKIEGSSIGRVYYYWFNQKVLGGFFNI